jgi:hypothetical protein
MSQILGNFIETFPPDHDALILTFTPNSQRIRDLWKKQRLSAHFLADYFVHFLPVQAENPQGDDQWVKEIKGTVSYVANELLENAMKFNLASSRYKVRLGIHFPKENTDAIAVIFASNSVNRQGADKFQHFIQELLDADPEAFYMQQVEASAQDENGEASGLGFLTMINDYQAKLGWKFEVVQTDPEIITVTTMAQVPM